MTEKRHAPPLIDSQRAVETMLNDVRKAPVVGIDAEMDSYFSYFPKLCLIQVSTARADYLLDPLAEADFSALGEVAANPDQVKVFHAGANDIPYLRKALGCDFSNLFDTHVAARILGLSRNGLASLLEEHFGVALDKKYQRADWRLRPLPREQADYARLDTRYLLPLREKLLSRLEQEGRQDEARSEFRKVCHVEAGEKTFDADDWARLKGVRELPRSSRALVRQLYLWREEQARTEDRAVFRVLPDGLLLAVAQRRPRNRTELMRMSRHPTLRVLADDILACLEEGAREGEIPIPRPSTRPGRMPLTGRQKKLYDQLRRWRNKLSLEQELEPDRIASNRLLKKIAEADPRTAEQLKGVDGMEPWRLSKYGEGILALLGG